MTGITLSGCDPYTLLSHMALYGLGAILEADGARDVRLAWTRSANPRPVISAGDLDGTAMAEIVGRHASAHHAEDSWVQRDITLGGEGRGLMSPRLSQFGDKATWELVQISRHEVLDLLTAGHDWLDLRFLAALGEPCYWSFDAKGATYQDDGANRLEMQPRNRGSEFMRNRLRPLARTVALRDPAGILVGLRGETVTDELENNSSSGLTATGLASPGPADNALVWCALWGICQFPIAMRINRTALTSGHISNRRRGRYLKEWLCVPMWHGAWNPARLRSILASQFPVTLAMAGLDLDESAHSKIPEARAWLAARNVEGVVRFSIQNFSSGHADQRRAMRGEAITVQGGGLA